MNVTASERRVMLVTGASSGIGRALAERAARAGWRVFAIGRRAERLEALMRSVDGATGAVATLAVDIRESGAPARIVRDALERFGRIDVLVNNAGTVAAGPITFQSDEALHEQFETHAIVPLALAREALGELRHHRGQIVFVGSGVARIPVGGLGAYPPAKAAVRNLARIARNELRPFGIAVTYVDPGAVATEFMTRAGFSGPPSWLGVSPYDVARRILDAIERRKPVVNAVPWQTLLVSLAELFPALTDFILTRAPGIVGNEIPAPVSQQTRELPEFARRLEPLPDTPQPPPKAKTKSKPKPKRPKPGSESVTNPEEKPETKKDERPLSAFEAALEPLASRMSRSNLRVIFLQSLLVPGTELDVADVALGWAGMPNKHERELTGQVLEALADAGFLARAGENRYTVLRAAD